MIVSEFQSQARPPKSCGARGRIQLAIASIIIH